MYGTQSFKRLTAVAFCVSAVSFSSLTFADTQISNDALDTWFKAGNYEKIITTLEDEQDKSPERFTTYISALMNTDLDDAEEAADDFVRAYPDNYRVYLLHASVMGAQAGESIFSALGYASKAKDSLEKATKVAPQEIQTYQALLQFHLFAPSIAGGDMDEARRIAERITELDASQGQFAKARILLADDSEEQGIALLKTLTEQPETRIEAMYVLGNQYLTDEKYQQAITTLQPLTLITLTPAARDDKTAWDNYSNSRFNQLYGMYRIGHVAVKSGEFTGLGIQALEAYLTELPQTDIDNDGLPSLNWANLRLAQLYLNASNKAQAKRALQRINGKEDERFGKLLKGLRKKV